MAGLTIRVLLEPSPALLEALQKLANPLLLVPKAEQVPAEAPAVPERPIARPGRTPIGHLWSPERLEQLRNDWVDGVPTQTILAALSKHPGPVLTKRQVINRACMLGLRRPGEPKWSPEREAILLRDWPTSRHIQQIRTEINALPGPALTEKQIEGHAAYRDIQRPVRKVAAVAAPIEAPIAASHKPPQPEPIVPEPLAPSLHTPAPVPAQIETDSRFPKVPGVVGHFRQALQESKAAASSGPVSADIPTIRAWAEPRGLAPNGTPMSIPAVNAKRESLGLPPYRVIGPGGLAR